MSQDSEPKPLVPYWRGDPEDHEVLNAYLGPWWGGCVTWAVSALAIGYGGYKLFEMGSPGFRELPIWVRAAQVLATGAAAGITWPIASFVGWVGHHDFEHYSHDTEHFHIEMAAPKAAWNMMAWAVNSLAKRK